MKQYKLNSVFIDDENFNPAKRLKCVEGDYCRRCGYDIILPCAHNIACTSIQREDGIDVYFIETDEHLTTEP